MRLLHTSDWHLGRQIDGGMARIAEQSDFIDELTTLVDNRRVDLVIIAGDVFNNYNPSAAAEQLFYDALARLGNYGMRPVVVIAGNHDNPERLVAAGPLAARHGVILLGKPDSIAKTGDFTGFSIINAVPGCFEIVIGNEHAVIISMPYPSERTLNEIIPASDEHEYKNKYSRRIGAIFSELSKNFRPDTINIATGHFYIAGGETSASERDIQLGGAYAVDSSALPTAQYIAMGHLHRPQRVANAYYSGSPLQYSKSEIGIAKSVNIVDIVPGGLPIIERVFLRNYKPLERWRVQGIDEALKLCRIRSKENCWVFLEIISKRTLLQSEIKELHRLKADILEITPILDTPETIYLQDMNERSISEEFTDYYTAKRGVAPTPELVDLFLKLVNE